MPRNKTLLLHPFFLLNLLLLIVNDHWWKQEYHNFLTGKISDFSGVFVMAVFLIACCGFKKIYVVLLTALFFTWWKSPLSEPIITAVGLARVIDYSDLMALIILPAIFYIKPYQIPQLRYALPIVALITWTAMVATSLPYRPGGYYYPVGQININETWTTKLNEQDFLHRLDSLHITYKKDSFVYLPLNSRGILMVVKTGNDSMYNMVPVDDLKDTLFYYQKQLGSHYSIPYLALEKDTLTNVRFRFGKKGKKTTVELMEVTIPNNLSYSYYYQRPVRKKYMELMKTFMLKK